LHNITAFSFTDSYFNQNTVFCLGKSSDYIIKEKYNSNKINKILFFLKNKNFIVHKKQYNTTSHRHPPSLPLPYFLPHLVLITWSYFTVNLLAVFMLSSISAVDWSNNLAKCLYNFD
jgi:hypothetical protein